MFPILYENIETGVVPSHNGLGILSDAISCRIEQERNGKYELEMKYSMSGIHASELVYRRIIKAKPNFTDDPQLFRIDRIGKVMNGMFTVYAKHISYDLSGYEIVSGEANSAVAACSLLQSSATGYTITTDKTTSGNFKITEPSSVRSWFAGKAGSFLDVFGTAELKYNNFNIQFLLHAGKDRGVTIRYGKNLLELSQELADSNLATHVMCYWKSAEGDVVSSDKIATGLVLDVPKTLVVDCSSSFEEMPTVEQLTAKAEKYVDNNNLTTPKNNIKLDFVQSGELKDRVDLCDTVSIYYEALGITRTQVKCIRTVWDCIREKYIETEFGEAKTNIADTIVVQQKEIQNKPSTSIMQEAVNRATALITGNLGGYVILHDSNGDKCPDEILIMDTDDITTATKVWRWNKNGLGYSDSGYDGEYGLAMTADGEIVADFITTGVLNADLIKAGVIQDVAGNSTIDMANGQATLFSLLAKRDLTIIGTDNKIKGFFSQSGDDNAILQLNNSSTEKAVAQIYGNGTNAVLRLADTTERFLVSLFTSDNGGYLHLKNANNELKIYGNGETGDITCVSCTQTSSRKVKENIKPIEDSEKILELEAVSFDYKNKAQGTDKRGFIAEDVKEILPNLVKDETKEMPATLDYISMIPYLQDVIKKQEIRIKVLEEKLNGTDNA